MHPFIQLPTSYRGPSRIVRVPHPSRSSLDRCLSIHGCDFLHAEDGTLGDANYPKYPPNHVYIMSFWAAHASG